MRYYGKIVKAGNVIHTTSYEKPVGNGKDDKRKKSLEDMPEWIQEEIAAEKEKKIQEKKHKESKESIQKRCGLRAKRKLMDLIRANCGHKWADHNGEICTTKFLTLTFAENLQDLEKANDLFNKFIKRLNYKVTGEKKAFLKYIAVVEFQKRGAVHYHCLFFNMAYTPIETISEVWGHGFVGVNAIDHVDDLGAYVSKYMGKSMDDENGDDDPDKPPRGKRRRDKDKKRYFTSRGLIKPEVIACKTHEELDQWVASLAHNEVYTYEYDTEYYGRICYKQYNTKRKK